jgi:hypothetical protein
VGARPALEPQDQGAQPEDRAQPAGDRREGDELAVAVAAEKEIGDRLGERDHDQGADRRDEHGQPETGAEASPVAADLGRGLVLLVVLVLVVHPEDPLEGPLLGRQVEENREQAGEEEQQPEAPELGRAEEECDDYDAGEGEQVAGDQQGALDPGVAEDLGAEDRPAAGPLRAQLSGVTRSTSWRSRAR